MILPFKARMCIFIVMCKDGTPFEVASIMEKDIVEFCVMLGHIHPLSVFQYSTTELVILFCMVEEMYQASCGAIKATELHDEPITVKIVAPTEPHVKAYIHEGGGYPPKLWSLPSEEEDDVNSLIGNPNQGGGTPQCLQADLGDLSDRELQQLMEDLQQEIALHELHTPPAICNQLPGVNPQGMVITRRMTQRSPFQEGRVGSPGTATSNSSTGATR